MPSDIIYPNYVAENLMLHYRSNQTWYWLPDQQPDEVLVFKAVDSDKRYNHRTSPRILQTLVEMIADSVSLCAWRIPSPRAGSQGDPSKREHRYSSAGNVR